MSFTVTALEIESLWPEIILVGGAIAILLLDLLWPKSVRASIPLSLLVVVAAAGAALRSLDSTTYAFGGLLEATPVTTAWSLVALTSAFLALLASQAYLRREGILGAEYPVLLLWCVAGVTLLLRSTELLTLFVALELLSVGLYALAAYHRGLSNAVESALKYFLMGAFVSAFVLLGIALLYGELGTTDLSDIATALQAPGSLGPTVSLGLLLLVAGFAFKMSLVPFHAWSPDTYQGAPSPFVAFLSVAPKVASVLVLIRLLELTHGDAGWSDLVVALSVLSMIAGNLLALAQKDVKRMLAYSGIGHMGYLLIPLADLSWQSRGPVFVYLVAYTLMNAGAFAVITALYARAGEQHLTTEISGWGHRFPLHGIAMTVCMLSLAGVPPTLGFLGKVAVFTHAIANGRHLLVLVGVATSLIGAFYYLRVIYVLYMKPEVHEPQGLLIDGWGRLALVLAAGGTIAFGVWTTPIFDLVAGILGG